jgi:drug/metabolite transporter (DMT)-like permease
MLFENMQSNKWLFIASFFSALTILIIKFYERKPLHWLLLVALISESIIVYSYIELLKMDDILTQFSLVKIISIIFVLISSILFFGNVLTYKKIIGLVFGILGIYLIT